MKEVKINIVEFCEKYKKLVKKEQKKSLLENTDFLRRTYAPIIEKRLVLDAMLQNGINRQNNVEYIDMTNNKINLYMAVIALYTNFEIPQDENGKSRTLEAYDGLVSSGLFNKICEEIGSDEIKELISVNDSLIDGWYRANSSAEGIIHKLLDAFINTTSSSLNSIVESDKFKEFLGSLNEVDE